MSDFDQLIEKVAEEFEVNRDAMLGKSRVRALVDARCALVNLLLTCYNTNWAGAAKFINRERTSIGHITRRHDAMMTNVDDLSEDYAASYKRLEKWCFNTHTPDMPKRARRENVHSFMYTNWPMVDKVRQFAAEQRTSTRDAMTYLLNRGFSTLK
jgi:hypothetical protein